MSTPDAFGISNSTLFSSPTETSPPGFPYSPITPNSLNSESLNSSSPGDSKSSSSRNFNGFQVNSTQLTPFIVF